MGQLQIEKLDIQRHKVQEFRCGDRARDNFLHFHASGNAKRGISATHLLIDSDNPSVVLGYYCLSAAQILIENLTEADQSQLPRYPVPCARIGQLGVALSHQRQGYGSILLQNAVKRCLIDIRQHLGIYALIADAASAAVVPFYLKYGFVQSAMSPLVVYLPLGS